MDILFRSKLMAKALRKSLGERGVELSHSDCLEIVSQQLGFVDWNTCKAKAENKTTISTTIFVEHGREHEAALFYERAFGATIRKEHASQGEVIAIELLHEGIVITVAGSNPRREAEPWRGGPFFPKEPGSVSTVMRLEVKDAAAMVAQAKLAGAIERDTLEIDADGHRLAVIFDPFGHMWAIRERKPSTRRLAA